MRVYGGGHVDATRRPSSARLLPPPSKTTGAQGVDY